jgi:hypothetical protein
MLLRRLARTQGAGTINTASIADLGIVNTGFR